jgi:hypothetical protein
MVAVARAGQRWAFNGKGASRSAGVVTLFKHHQEKKAAKEYQTKLAAWQEQRDAYAELVSLTQTYTGDSSTAIMLKAGETVFASVDGAALVEDRRGAGQWTGRSQGVSFPIGSLGGRSIRYRVGRTKGHYVQAAPIPTAIDRGTLVVTNMRVVFQGAKQTRECLFGKLIGFQHDDDAGQTVISVSNRQKPTCVAYGPTLSSWFDFRLDLAIAHYRNAVPALVQQLQDDLAALDASKPAAPPPII